jgi:hypothetical protein
MEKVESKADIRKINEKKLYGITEQDDTKVEKQ